MIFAKLTDVTDTYDYIIAGGGMAGLSLAFYLNGSSLKNKKTLIIDRDSKNKNDHTWCFWEKENGAFEEIVFRKWQKVWFHGTNNFSENLDLGEYEYKMIRAADFYEFIFEKIRENPNFTFLRTEIVAVKKEKVLTKNGELAAKEFIFDSFTRKNYDNPKYQNLWQHFYGWLIETPDKVFNPDAPTLFDFRVEQKSECRFIYILPFSEKEALIEFTVFSENLLEKKEYKENLDKYISEILETKNYKILETETGVIPMSDEPHDEFPAEKIIRIGTSGGYIKPSTGYSFNRTQRRLNNLVFNLENKIPNPKFQIQNWKSYLDSVLLNVLLTNKHPANNVFTTLFAKNKTEQVLKFLDEDTSLAEDLQIMKTVPLKAFTKAAAQTAIKKLG